MKETLLTWRGAAQDVAVQHEVRQLGYHSGCWKVHAILYRATIAQIVLGGFLIVPQCQAPHIVLKKKRERK